MGTVVVLTALDVEYAAVRAHLTYVERGVYQGGTGFETGTLAGSALRVILGLTGEGSVSAAVVAERAITAFRPQLLLYVGVAGGLKEETRLGDVVVASRVYSVHGGKYGPDGFMARPRSWEAPHEWLDLAHHLVRTRSWQGVDADETKEGFAVHVKPIAAGDAVLDSRESDLAWQLRVHYNDAVAVEMEGAGAAHAAHLNHRLPVVVVRGISDRADGVKHAADAAGWQQVAAAHAAAFAFDLVRARFEAITPNIAQGASAAARLPGSHLARGPRQLPAAASGFVGRGDELAQLLALARRAEAKQDPGTVVISAIDGMAGVGKTALAVYAAHRMATLFPGGQLFVDLRGYTEGVAPRESADALATLLSALGVPSDVIPADLDARAALYRDRLAATRTLIVLDNAATEAQVRPLLPADPGCLVLVTSRKRLRGLDNAVPVPLDVLSEKHAVALLSALVGGQRIRTDDPHVHEVVALCGRLPLAVRLVGALLRHRPTWGVEHIAALLRDQRERMEMLADGERDLPLVFDLSYNHLPLALQTHFSLLGLIPGPDFDVHAAAALTGAGLNTARRALEELVDHNLLTEPRTGRYQLHDLLRLYAVGKAGNEELAELNRAAARRLIEYYLHTAHTAERILHPYREPIAFQDPGAELRTPAIGNPKEAMAWFDAEHPCLLAAQSLAARRGHSTAVWQLAWSLDTYHQRRGLQSGQIAAWQAGLSAAERAHDKRALALAHRRLGDAYTRADSPERAIGHLKQALALAQQTGDVPAQAHIHYFSTWAWEKHGDDRKALRHAELALGLYLRLDTPVWQARARNQVGWYSSRLGLHEQARAQSEQALELFHRDREDREGEATTLDTLGRIADATGRHPQAQDYYHRACELFRAIGSTYAEAGSLERLGDSHHAAREPEQARHAWQQALTLHQEHSRASDAGRIQRKLTALDDNPSS